MYKYGVFEFREPPRQFGTQYLSVKGNRSNYSLFKRKDEDNEQ